MTPDIDRMLADAAAAEELFCEDRDVARLLARGHVPILAAHIRALAEALAAAEVERDHLRDMLDADPGVIFADGCKPTTNERHLHNLLTWRVKEAEEARANLEACTEHAGDLDSKCKVFDAEVKRLQARVAALVTAGTVLSNAAYGLSQRPGVPLEPAYCDHLRQLQRDWESVAFVRRDSGAGEGGRECG